jgi:hypothetical protein
MIERFMGLFLGEMVQIDLPIRPHLTPTQPRQRSLVEASGDAGHKFGQCWLVNRYDR